MRKVAQAFDVIVVGGGGSGLAAALEAAGHGASVAVVEKASDLGGTTALSVGSFAAAGTALQHRAGIADTPDAYFEDIDVYLGAALPGDHRGRDNRAHDNRVLRRLLVDRSTATLDWLTGLGLVFHGPFPDPPQRVARLHNVLPASRAYIHTLARACRRRGVTFFLDTRARRLTGEGRVGGLEAARGGETLALHARRGVVLASGDITAGAEYRARFLPGLAGIEAINPRSTGDGHAMAEAVGSRVLNGDLVTGPIIRFALPQGRALAHAVPPTPLVGRAAKFWLETMPAALVRPALMRFLTVMLAPSPALLERGAALIDRAGDRVRTDSADGAAGGAAVALARAAGGAGHFVLDRRLAALFDTPDCPVSGGPGIAAAYLRDYRRHRPDVIVAARDAVELAARLGVDPARLAAALAGHPLFRSGEPPFVALGPVRPLMLVSEASLPVSAAMEVLDASGAPIPGLYAAGSIGQGGMILPAHGQHIAWAFVSGRIAGESAARHGG
jgi:fumarate reductase flavoprotein subunit